MIVEKDKLISSIENFLNDENLELYDINISNFPSISKIEIFVHSKNDIDLTTYERLSYLIQRQLEEFHIPKGTYDLIVSSPGIERKLKTIRHYELSLNEIIKIKLYQPINGEYLHVGKLLKVDNENIVIANDEKEFTIDIKNIKKTKIYYEKFKEKISN